MNLAWTACVIDSSLGEKTQDEAFSKDNLNNHLKGNGEVTDFVYNNRGTSVVKYLLKGTEYIFEISSSGNVTSGGEASISNAVKSLNRQKLDDLYEKGWSIGETSTGYFAADYDNMVLYTLDSSLNITGNTTLSLSDESLFTIDSNGLITDTTASGVVVIPKSISGYTVTEIAASAFENKKTITRIIIPPTLTIINNGTSTSTGAFCGCAGLVDIAFSKNLTSIGNYAFYNCSKLGNICFSKYVTTLGTYALFGCKLLNSIEIPSGITSLSNYVFDGCAKITSIKIPSNITSVGNYAFYGCSGLTNVEIPNSVTSIGTYAFYGCKLLESIEIPSGITSLANYVFDGCAKISSIKIPNSVTNIGNYAFYGCSSLTSIEIPSSVKTIGTNVFNACTGLNSISVAEENTVYDSRNDCNAIIKKSNNTLLFGCKTTTIPTNVYTIEASAFSGCTGLTDITNILTNVNSVGNFAFSGCTGLTNLEIPSNIVTLGNNPFYGCKNIESINVDSGNTVFDSRDNCNAIIKTANNSLVTGCKNSVIKNTVEIIGAHSFRGITNLTSIVIPSSVTTIAGYAFNGCTGFTSIEIPNSVTSIETYAYSGCTGLTSIEIPSSVTTIGTYAFYNCNKVTSVYIKGTNLNKVEKNAFSTLKSGSTIYVGDNSISSLFTSNNYSTSKTTILIDSNMLGNT